MNAVHITGTPSTKTPKLKTATNYEICLKKMKSISTDKFETHLLNLYTSVLNISYAFLIYIQQDATLRN
jgi:hypothetical protein